MPDSRYVAVMNAAGSTVPNSGPGGAEALSSVQASEARRAAAEATV
jgi:hypothetical protein